jgi:hypothetical protein
MKLYITVIKKTMMMMMMMMMRMNLSFLSIDFCRLLEKMLQQNAKRIEFGVNDDEQNVDSAGSDQLWSGQGPGPIV